ncbi:GOLPH3/VPS74 family protein [Actinocorallia populi]|uniref:GOLPH3/VPS74 family protein n=1 Tax=Actinocorallia populi TaxID=2079200 RepID=UPI000D08AD32|nr:GPP34 family phosphoprotein [Actinocorallia populi]
MTLADDFLLLALHQEKGKPLVSTLYVEYGLVGAVLAELALAGRIGFDKDKVLVLDPTPVGTPEEDAALARLAEEDKTRRAYWWAGKLRSGLRQRALTRLVDAGVLDEERRTVLGVFPTTRHPEANPVPEQELRARLTSVLHGAPADVRDAALLSIVQACRLNRAAFPDIDKKQFKNRVESFAEDNEVGEVVRKTIQQIEGMMVAVMVAATAGASAGG